MLVHTVTERHVLLLNRQLQQRHLLLLGKYNLSRRQCLAVEKLFWKLQDHLSNSQAELVEHEQERERRQSYGLAAAATSQPQQDR